ncbi:MAG: hypothetical protein ACRD2W_14400 [Acidimicrobiales bacterium]
MSVFVVLGLIWAAVLIPPVLRARAERRAEFIDSFQEQMGALRKGRREAAALNDHRVARRRVSPAKRRRDVLGGLVGAMLGALVLGAFPSLRLVWVLFLFLLNLFLGYVALLAHQRNLARRRRMQRVRTARVAPAPARARAPLAPALDSTR